MCTTCTHCGHKDLGQYREHNCHQIMNTIKHSWTLVAESLSSITEMWNYNYILRVLSIKIGKTQLLNLESFSDRRQLCCSHSVLIIITQTHLLYYLLVLNKYSCCHTLHISGADFYHDDTIPVSGASRCLTLSMFLMPTVTLMTLPEFGNSVNNYTTWIW